MVSDDLRSSAKILIVDDDPNILELYVSILRIEGYLNIKTMLDPRGVLALFVEYEPDILILDITMPHLDGIQLLSALQTSACDGLSLPILVVTGTPSPDNRLRALRTGAVDVLGKPFDCSEFVLRIANLLKIRLGVNDIVVQSHVLFEELLERTEALSASQIALKEAQLEVIARLARAGEQHDGDTGEHTQRVAITSGLLAEKLGFGAEEVDIIRLAAPLHDVGKIGVPDSILLKPARLTDNEYAVMRSHCQIGAQLLSGGRSEIVQMAELIALSHHEHWNGGGYPHGLDKENVPIEGRILAVADVFDALTHARPYKGAWSVAQALAEIRQQAGQHFDPQVVEAFLDLPHHELI